ncbi:acetoin utilization protein AcuC [Nesterenkonia sp. AY15]|uniref:acetoin utilization protein AcuC n=1 Tax=unclassified Nesterenkonia TaxID=2629769 RepID=UPI001F4C7F95|nr:acetoin utilization protein AcuC [Nesterenkonia sp. YGD6]MCH8572013.1 acetoin utilization protein AcuC [Nesterenkonia sp. AY15]
MGELPAAVVWDEALLEYRFNSNHPMDPVRLELTAKLCDEFGLFSGSHVRQLKTGIASDTVLGTVHSADYITAVKNAAEHGHASDDHGLGTEDTPVFSEIHLGAARIVDGTRQCAQALLDGTAVRALNFSGGMHHAARSRAGGFCVYNDSAVAIQLLLDQGTRRVVYIDVDAHHGDGTQDIFYDDPRVMTISIHQTGVALYPGTGFPNEAGGPGAEGSAVNIALPETTGDAGWLRAFHAVIPQLVAAFEPEVIVSQHGCDSHRDDPLSDLQLSVDAQRQSALDIAHLADEHCEGRWIATGGGGYAVHTVVPRSWTHLTGVIVGAPLSLKTVVPRSWRDHVRERYQVCAPETMGDDAELWWRSWELGYDPSDAVDRAVMQTRKEIFPLYGLDPWFD